LQEEWGARGEGARKGLGSGTEGAMGCAINIVMSRSMQLMTAIDEKKRNKKEEAAGYGGCYGWKELWARKKCCHRFLHAVGYKLQTLSKRGQKSLE